MDSNKEYKDAIEVSIVFHEGNRMFAVPKQPAPVPEGYKQSPEHSEVFTKAQLLQYGADCVKAAQPAPVHGPSLTDLAGAIEYADARWSGVDVPIEWARHFADAIGKPYASPPAQPAPVQPVAWLEILRNNKTATDEVIGAFLRGHAEHLTGETFVLTTPPAQEFVCSTGLCHYKAQRQWVNLTHDEYDAICDKHSAMSDFDFLADIEAKLKEKNQ
jgi:hypothetical protein